MTISFFAPVEANFTDNTVGLSSAFNPTETPSITGLGNPAYNARHAATTGTPGTIGYVPRHASN